MTIDKYMAVRIKVARNNAKTIAKKFMAGDSFEDIAASFGVDVLVVDDIYRKQMKKRKK